MALNYDFDMLSMAAKAASGEAFPAAPPMALFRDPATVAALERAPQPVQDYLRASHFGINCYHSGAPAGRYPDADETARITVIEALAWNVSKFTLPRADDSQPVPDEFHLPAFFAAVAEAEPMVMPDVPVPEVSPEPEAPTRTVADTLIADLMMAEDSLTAEVVAEPAPAAAMIPDLITLHPEPADDIGTDGLIAEMMACEEGGAETSVIDALPADVIAIAVAPAEVSVDAAAIAAMPARRFRLPALPRWVTAGAALAVLGVAFGSALI
jgi:hypothetical protein